MTTKRKQTTTAGDVGENIVRVAMDSIGTEYRKQQQRTGRGYRWKPDFIVKRRTEEDWSEASFVEVKAQFQYGSADSKIAGQALRAHRMGLQGWFVLITHKDRDMFSQDVIADTNWMLEQLGSKVKVVVGTDALITELKAAGYSSPVPGNGVNFWVKAGSVGH